MGRCGSRRAVAIVAIALFCTVRSYSRAADVPDSRPADSSSAVPGYDPDHLYLTLRLGGWFTNVSGETGVRGLTTNVDVGFNDLIEQTNIALFPSLNCPRGTGCWPSTGCTPTSLMRTLHRPAGEKSGFDVTSNMGVADVALGYTIIRTRTTTGVPFTLTPGIGGRWTYVDAEINPLNLASRSQSRNWFDPYIGLQATVGITPTLDWRIAGTVGGFDIGSRFTWTRRNDAGVALFPPRRARRRLPGALLGLRPQQLQVGRHISGAVGRGVVQLLEQVFGEPYMRPREIIRPSAAVAVATFLLPCLVLGCASKPPLKEGGFLEDYSKLQPVDDSFMRYVSPQLKTYRAYIVDPVEFTVPPQRLSEKDLAEVARYFRSKLIELLRSRQYQVVDDVDVNVARIQIAMTDVAESTWWKKLHPVSRVAGAGTGGASCEGEIIDSVTGEQLAAWIRTSSGNQFNFLAFSTVADVKSAIDKWASDAANRLDEFRKSQAAGA